MARPLRIEYSGALYHVLNRGVERRKIFGGDRDCEEFLGIIRALFPRYRVTLHAYCLMPNHYHLFLRTPLGKLRRFMQELGGDYGMYYNKRHHRVGPLFQGRYKAQLVDKDEYALQLSRYIHMNPVMAGMARKPEDYRWSSYRTYMGAGKADTYLHTGFLLAMFQGNAGRRRAAFRSFTLDKAGEGFSPVRESVGGVIAGAEGFVRWVRKEKVPRGHDVTVSRLAEIQKPSREVLGAMRTRVGALTADARLGRKLLLYGLKKSTTLTLTEIAKLTGGKSPAAVAQTVHRLGRQRRGDGNLNSLLERLDSSCRGSGGMSNVKL